MGEAEGRIIQRRPNASPAAILGITVNAKKKALVPA
jgi:hypothetical protein